MPVIQKGFGDKPLYLSFEASDDSFSIRVNIEQEGLNIGAEPVIQRYETLSYATLEEIIILRDELNKVIAKSVGI
jgi:hypothetical protein